MFPSDDLVSGDRAWPSDQVPVHVEVNGTTLRVTYEVEGAAVLLASPEFGNASAALNGRAPGRVAARLLPGEGRGGGGAQ